MEVKDLRRRITLTLGVAFTCGVFLSGCSANAEVLQESFISDSSEIGFRCVATEPIDSRVETMTTCSDNHGEEIVFVIFKDPDDTRGADLMFWDPSKEIIYGESWILVGQNQNDLESLSQLIN